jgi:two-component system phosphate regulon sensor histidine kinase PhoR
MKYQNMEEREMTNNMHSHILQDNLNIYDMVINNLPIGFSVVDLKGSIVDFNKAAEKITGYDRNEVIGKDHLRILHGTDDKSACPLLSKTLQEHREAIATENTILKKSGEYITKSVTTFPLFDESGSIIGGVELFRDISEFKRMERERKNILSMFAHDMKNPVVTAGGFLARLISGKIGEITERQQDYLKVIGEQLTILDDLIKHFLEFSKLDTAQLEPSPGPFNIEMAIEHHIEASSVKAERKNIEVKMLYPEDISPVINADGAMISRVIANLLDNAIKYTDPGGTVTVRLADIDDLIQIDVVDTGIGIPEDRIHYIFDAFYRISRDSAGAGLGLSIAKTIVEIHGGKIGAESTHGKGSTFTFTLPKNKVMEKNT